MNCKETLTSRERVLKAINFQEADRVPIDLGGFQTGIHKKAYEALIEYLGIEEQVEILDPVQQLARPSEAVLERFHVDTRYICAHGPDSFKGGIEKNERDGRSSQLARVLSAGCRQHTLCKGNGCFGNKNKVLGIEPLRYVRVFQLR